ncbi:MAG: type II secretion system protein [Patescibacteria group bacterium]
MRSKSGFTIVELLIVIVVIGVLATITIVAYNGIQNRANDTRRISDVSNMQKALLLYRTQSGSFPQAVPNPGYSTWEISTDPNFLNSLSSITSTKFSAPAGSVYWYRAFNAGEYGCPVNLGPYHILWAHDMKTQSAARIDSGPCTGQTLFVTSPTAGAFTVGANDYAVYGF